MVKITFFEVEPWEKEYIIEKMRHIERKFLEGMQLEFVYQPAAAKNIAKYVDSDIISVFIQSKLNKTLLSKFKKLTHVNTMSTGYDHIDLKYCESKNITVSNVPSYGENTVAEHAFALILAISRQILPCIKRTRRGSFKTGPELRGFDLKDKTLGVIGTGRIGRHSIQMGKGFQMNVIGYDAYPNEDVAKELAFTYVKELDELLTQSDVITMHAPLLPSTKHMINMKNINKVKKGALFINTARGGLIETKALLHAIDEGIFSAAGIDVLEEEKGIIEERALLAKDYKDTDLKTLLQEHTLIEYDNVLVTPHNAFNTEEALKRILDTSVENIKGFIHKQPVNLVKPK